MDLWQLKIFQKVVDLEGFSKAAEAVNLTQPTVSSHIKDLENHFDCRLVDRLGKKAIPTKAGRLLYSYSQRLIRLADETEAAMADFLGKVSGQLDIGGSTIPGGYILPKVIGDFSRKYPGARIAVQVADTRQIVDRILENTLDFGVVGAKMDGRRLMQKELIQDEMRLIVCADHKWADRKHIDIQRLIKEPFLIREKGSGTLKSLQNSLSRMGFDINALNIAAELGSTAAIIQGIKSRIGISILSPIAVADELNAGTVKALTIDGLDLKRSFYLTCHKDRTPSPLCRAFIEFLEERFL